MLPLRYFLKKIKKTFVLKDLIVKKKYNFETKNIIEKISMYPNLGVGFRIRKITWNDSKWIEIVRTELDTNQKGTIWGYKYEEGTKISEVPFKVPRTTTRGYWNYELGDSYVELDNGVIYSLVDMREFYESNPQREKKTPDDWRVNMDWDLQQQVENIDEHYYKFYGNPKEETN